MRSNLLGLGLCGAVAAVAVAGSASAGFTATVLDSFGGSYTSDGSGGTPVVFSTPTLPMGSWTGWNYFTYGTPATGQSKMARASVSAGPVPSTWATVAEGSGTLTVSNAAGVKVPPTSSPGQISSGVSYVANTNGAFNLSGLGDVFYFDNVTTGAGAQWSIRVASIGQSGNTIFTAVVNAGQLVGSRYYVPFSAFSSSVAGQTLNSTTAAKVASIFLGQALTSESTATTTSSMTEFGIIPAPGAAALLGAAGLVSSRRRRA